MKTFLTVVVLAVVATSLSGCLAPQPPQGKPPGRVEVTNTTPAEAASPEVQQTALHEFSDQVAQQLAADFQRVPELNQSYRVTVVFGDIVNKTEVVPTTDFEAFRTRIRQKLMQSQMILKNIRFVENKARVNDLIAREGDNAPGRASLDPKYTYFLNGEMYRSTRTATHQEVNEYLMSYNLTSMDTGEIIWTNSPYEVKQVR
jgi:hypothetical protein